MAGFRSSIFGFNKDDVMEYIKTSRETSNKKINELNEQLEIANKDNLKLKAQNDELNAKLNEFISKQEEIELLSKSIAKMHIIANANANALMQKATESVEISSKQVAENLKCAEDASAALTDIRSKLSECCGEFCNKVDSLSFSLDEVKSSINENNRQSQEKINSFIEAFNKVDNT